ncbi:MAG: DUF58 domain-containing protein [bacterium]|nr:DUF58 domain-containing protein [bacterium]
MTFDEWLANCATTLALHTTTKLRQARPGNHRSPYTGNGFRLRQHETYRLGDERRFIDWKASRKEQTLLMQRFEAETQLQLIVLCDVSASMLFGQHLSKYQIALDCTGLLALATLRQADAFGLIAFADETIVYHPPKQRRDAVLRCLDTLWHYTPSAPASNPTTNLASVLRYIPVSRPALLCVMSDFRMPDWRQTLDHLSASHDTFAVLIEDDSEISLPAVGRVVVRDFESGRLVELDTASRTFRRAYHERMLEERAGREQALQRACGPQYMIASASTDYQSDLLRLFLARTAHVWV